MKKDEGTEIWITKEEEEKDYITMKETKMVKDVERVSQKIEGKKKKRRTL